MKKEKMLLVLLLLVGVLFIGGCGKDSENDENKPEETKSGDTASSKYTFGKNYKAVLASAEEYTKNNGSLLSADGFYFIDITDDLKTKDIGNVKGVVIIKVSEGNISYAVTMYDDRFYVAQSTKKELKDTDIQGVITADDFTIKNKRAICTISQRELNGGLIPDEWKICKDSKGNDMPEQ